MRNYGVSIKENEDFYITIVIDPANDTQSFYYNGKPIIQDGEVVSSTNLNTSAWNNMMRDDQYQGDGYFIVGKSSQGKQGTWYMLKGNIYAYHLYSRPLTDNEILANYNASVAYHNILTGGGSSGTSENIEGGDNF